MILKLKQTPGLYLVGFMGSGKTTIGKLLANRLGWTFADIDEDIAASQQRSISDIFDSLGEQAFRRMETEALRARVKAVARGIPMVMALGGGAAAEAGNLELIENHGVTIWLSCPFDVVMQRVMQDNPNRPLARDMKKFEELFYARQQAYGRADFRFDSVDNPETVVEAILNLPLFR